MDRPVRRDLSFPPPTASDPVVGWRYWHLRLDPLCLGSVTQKGFTWPARRAIHARCVSSAHPSPAPGCACGIYAGRDRSALRDHGLCLPAGGLVIGEVALWGTVLEDEDGYRGEHGYPRALSVVAETVDSQVRDGVVQRLSEAYGVPVATTSQAEAVGEISAAIAAFLDMSR